MVDVDLKNAGILEEIEDPPIHFLEAFRRVIVMKNKKKIKEEERVMSVYSCTNSKSMFVQSALSMREEMVDAGISYMHRSVMDLKAKGIRIRPDPDLSAADITFVPGLCFSELRLPVQYLSDLTPIVTANMIAFEVLPHGCSSLVVLSYAMFMKSLVQSPQDVKELQDNGVILNRLANLEKVVQVIKDIDRFGLHDQDIFKDVKRRIEEHCRSRARTWLADLIYTRFRTPWTAITSLLECSFFALLFCRLFSLSIKDRFSFKFYKYDAIIFTHTFP